MVSAKICILPRECPSDCRSTLVRGIYACLAKMQLTSSVNGPHRVPWNIRGIPAELEWKKYGYREARRSLRLFEIASFDETRLTLLRDWHVWTIEKGKPSLQAKLTLLHDWHVWTIEKDKPSLKSNITFLQGKKNSMKMWNETLFSARSCFSEKWKFDNLSSIIEFG